MWLIYLLDDWHHYKNPAVRLTNSTPAWRSIFMFNKLELLFAETNGSTWPKSTLGDPACVNHAKGGVQYGVCFFLLLLQNWNMIDIILKMLGSDFTPTFKHFQPNHCAETNWGQKILAQTSYCWPAKKRIYPVINCNVSFFVSEEKVLQK